MSVPPPSTCWTGSLTHSKTRVEGAAGTDNPFTRQREMEMGTEREKEWEKEKKSSCQMAAHSHSLHPSLEGGSQSHHQPAPERCHCPERPEPPRN